MKLKALNQATHFLTLEIVLFNVVTKLSNYQKKAL